MPLRRHLIVIVIVVVSKVRNLGLPRRCCMERWRRTLNPVRTIEIQSVPSRPKEFYQLQKNDMTTTTTSPGNHPFEGLPVPRVPPSGNRAKPTQLLKLVLAFGDPTSMTYLTRVPRKQKVHNYQSSFSQFPTPFSILSSVWQTWLCFCFRDGLGISKCWRGDVVWKPCCLFHFRLASLHPLR